MSNPVRGGNEATEVVTVADLPRIPSTEAVGEVRRRVARVLGDLDVDAIEEKWLQECGQCDYGVGYPCTHPADDYRPTMLRLVGEVRRLRMLVGAVTLHGTGYRWRRSDGEVLILHPADVDVFLAADQVTETERLRTELEASALAAEKLFEQRDTAIAEAQALRERVRVAGSESRRLIAKAEAERDTAIRERDAMRPVVEAAKAWGELAVENCGIPTVLVGYEKALLAAVNTFIEQEAVRG